MQHYVIFPISSDRYSISFFYPISNIIGESSVFECSAKFIRNSIDGNTCSFHITSIRSSDFCITQCIIIWCNCSLLLRSWIDFHWIVLCQQLIIFVIAIHCDSVAIFNSICSDPIGKVSVRECSANW